MIIQPYTPEELKLLKTMNMEKTKYTPNGQYYICKSQELGIALNYATNTKTINYEKMIESLSMTTPSTWLNHYPSKKETYTPIVHILSWPIEHMPLLINNDHPLVKIIVSWRLKIGK